MSITSSNAVIIYKDNFFAPAGMPLVKFSADQSITSDGKMAAGYVPNIIPVTIMFEADSPSWRIIEKSLNAAKSLKTVVECEVVVTVPALAKSYTYKKGVIKSLTDLALKKNSRPCNLKNGF